MLIFSLVFVTAFNGVIMPSESVQAAFDPGGMVGPVDANTGFPMWYKDQNGLALELMESADAFGISAAVEPGNAFSEQIGFGPEGFWWSADAVIATGTLKARLVLGLEAAFAGESAIDGQQSSFGRVRYVIDGLTPGATYTIRQPFATVTEIADDAGSIFVTSDIGCFAVAGSSSCDPNNPLGNPLPQFSFGAALSSDIGPFLTWDTFNADPAQTDPLLQNADPAYADRQYVGNPGVEHKITGSPINQNFFRVEGPANANMPDGFIETDLFAVTGRLARAEAPVIDPIPAQTAQISNPISFVIKASDANLDPITFSITNRTSVTNEADAVLAGDVFSWTPIATGTAVFEIAASDGALTSTTTVTVSVIDTAPILASISISPATAEVIAGTKRQLAVSVLDAGGAQINPAPVIDWTSDNASIATVDAAGLVTSVAAGTAVITASNGAVSGTAQINVIPVTLTGGGLAASLPVEPATGFPKWYKDRNGLALELTEAADTFSISAPVEQGNAFSELIGFGPEGFWFAADSIMNTTGGKPAVLVQAVEAAFAGESAVNGQQSAFGRIRIRVDVNDPGTYIVTYPYGQKTFTIAAGDIGPGYEINDTNDIGCFAIPGVSSCDPNNPLGSPQAAFNFNGVAFSEIGPFLSWDTFDPINNDPALVNPAFPGRKYLGNVQISHAIKGSPTGNNFFRVEGPAGTDLDPAPGIQNSIQTNLFTVGGRLADVTPPTITVTAPNPMAVDLGVPFVDPGATALDDFDGDITAKIVATGTVDVTATGTYQIIYSVADLAGNSATATRTVDVIAPAVADIIPPVIVLNGAPIVNLVLGDVYVDAGAVASDNVDPTVAVTASGTVDTATLGTYTITYTAVDTAANAAIPVTRTVIVTDILPVDNIAPVIALSGASTVNLLVGDAYADAGAVASDNIDAAVTVVASGAVDTAVAGTYVITYNATDASGNAATPVTRTVIVSALPPVDIIPPVIALNGAATVNLTVGDAYIDAGASATDNIDAVVTVVSSGAVDTAVAGNYVITYNATDASGNAATPVTRTVIVTALPPVDNIPPVITINGANPATVVLGTAYADAGATAIDNVTPVITVVTSGTVNTALLGDYVITYTATDAAGNVATLSRTVTVVPAMIQTNRLPIISAIADQTVQAGREVRFVTQANDPDGDALIYSLTNSPVEAEINPINGEFKFKPSAGGNYPVTIQASDGRGGIASVTFMVIVPASGGNAVIGGGGKAAAPAAVTAINVPVTVNKNQRGNMNTTLPNGSQVDIQIPIRAVNNPTTFSVSQGSLTAQNTPVNANGAVLVGNQVFNINAADAKNVPVRTFANPLQITITVPGLPVNTANLGVYYFNDVAGYWQLVPGAVFNPANGQVSFAVDHLTKFAVFNVEGRPETIKASDAGSADDSKSGQKAVLGARSFADGTLIRIDKKKIFLIINQQKVRVRSLEELRKLGARKIFDISKDLADQIPEGHTSALSGKMPENGSLIKDEQGRIFVVRDGQRIQIRNLGELSRNYRGRKITAVGNDVLAIYPRKG